MKTYLTYGFSMALAGVLFTLIMSFSGAYNSAESMQSTQWVGTCVGLLIGIVFLALAMKSKRATVPADAPWGYGSALGTGVMTALFASIFGLVLSYIYFSYINPHMSDVIYQMQVAKMEAKGVPQDKIDQAEPMMRKMMTPIMMSCFQAFFGFIWGVILSLVIAIFFRNRATVATPPAAAI